MRDNMDIFFKIITLNILEILIIVCVSFVWGGISVEVLSRKAVSFERRMSLFFVAVWLFWFGYAQIQGVSLPYLMDFLGFASGGTLIGLDISKAREKLAEMIKKK